MIAPCCGESVEGAPEESFQTEEPKRAGIHASGDLYHSLDGARFFVRGAGMGAPACVGHAHAIFDLDGGMVRAVLHLGRALMASVAIPRGSNSAGWFVLDDWVDAAAQHSQQCF